LYGNCNGPGSSGFCIFDPSGPGSSATGECTDTIQAPEALIKPENLTGLKVIHPDADFTVIFFGCYACPYTREAVPALLEVIEEREDVRFVLIDFPIERHGGSLLAANAGNCVYDEKQQDYIAYAKQLYAANLSLGIPKYSETTSACTAQAHERTQQGIDLGKKTGVYGTPTYFIGNKPVVGPLNKRSLEKLINGEMRSR
jgi:protein-disulfide isomerase